MAALCGQYSEHPHNSPALISPGVPKRLVPSSRRRKAASISKLYGDLLEDLGRASVPSSWVANAELSPDNRRNLAAENFYGVQHFFVWQRRDTHLECDEGAATENFVHVKDLFRYRFSVAD